MSSVTSATAVVTTGSWAASTSGKSSSSSVQESSGASAGDILDISPEASECADLLPDLSQQSTSLKCVSPAALKQFSVATINNKPIFTSKHGSLTNWIFGLQDSYSFRNEDAGSVVAQRMRQMSALLQAGEENLDTKVSGILKDLGIELGKDETLQIKLNSTDKRIVVDGITDKSKAAKIEEALNADPTLAKDLLIQYAKKNVVDGSFIAPRVDGGSSPPAQVDSRVWGILIDDLLQRETGGSLSDLQLGDDGTLVTDNDSVANLLGEEGGLAMKIKRVLSADDQEPLEVSYAFKNDTLIDQEALSDEEIGQRVDEFKEGIKVVWQQYRSTSLTAVDQFKITFNRFGQMDGVDSAGDEALAAKDKNTIQSWFDGRWAKNLSSRVPQILRDATRPISAEESQQMRSTEAASRESDTEMNDARRDAAIHDILRRHQFEDGDTDEYEHEVQFTFDYNGEASYTVVSKEADAAIQKQIAEIAPDVTEGLKQYLQSQGVDTSDAMLVRFDENGKLTCDLADDDPRKGKAQAAIDKLNQALEQGQAIESLGATFDQLLKVKDLLVGMHDPDTNAAGFVVGGQGQINNLQISTGDVTVTIPLGVGASTQDASTL